jgi:hypothetical protein
LLTLGGKTLKQRTAAITRVALAALSLTCVAQLTLADVVVAKPTSASGQWYAPVTATSLNTGNTFWNNTSLDSKPGTSCNVGYWLQSTDWTNSGLGNCKNNSFVAHTGGPGTALPFLASTATPNNPVGFEFQNTGKTVVSLRLEDAQNKTTNELGYYTYGGGPNSVNGSNVTLHPLFPGVDSPDATQTVNLLPGETFGFYLCPGNAGTTHCEQSAVAYSGQDVSSNGRSGKFALFSESPVPILSGNATAHINNFWVGVEDGPGINATEGFGDYQDMLISVNVVPEPGFYGFLGLSLAVLFLFIARKKQTA